MSPCDAVSPFVLVGQRGGSTLNVGVFFFKGKWKLCKLKRGNGLKCNVSNIKHLIERVVFYIIGHFSLFWNNGSKKEKRKTKEKKNSIGSP